MKLCYQRFLLKVLLTQPVCFSVNPLFLLRSVLGRQLRSICCIAVQNMCGSCIYNQTCAYGWIFESIVSKNNPAVTKRDRASHPFILSLESDIFPDRKCAEFSFSITLLGKAIEYFPYIYAAFLKAGKYGILKQRVPFVITGVYAGEDSLLLDDGNLKTDIPPLDWQPAQTVYSTADNCELYIGDILVRLKTPLRFKTGGRYTIDFSAQDFFLCLNRRMETLCTLYGENNTANCSSVLVTEKDGNSGNSDGRKYFFPKDAIIITERNLFWRDQKYYSARQKKSIELGGVSGMFALSGTFTQKEINLLEFAKLFNAGKNTIFGLGRLDYWTRLKEK